MGFWSKVLVWLATWTKTSGRIRVKEGKWRTSATMSPFSACTWAMAPRSRITLNTSYTCSKKEDTITAPDVQLYFFQHNQSTARPKQFSWTNNSHFQEKLCSVCFPIVAYTYRFNPALHIHILNAFLWIISQKNWQKWTEKLKMKMLY